MTNTTLTFDGDDHRDRLPDLPGYDLLELVGQGGFSVVYRARQHRLNRDVAIRWSRHGGSEHLAAQMLLDEAAILARLPHPHVVSILDCLQDGARVYLVLEYVSGGNLQSRIDGPAQHPVAAAALVERLARTLDFIHRRGITHCNLKPTSVLLAAPPSGEEVGPEESCDYEQVFGIPLISSFGLALDDQRRARLGEGEIRGTPAYMAPEQALGNCRDTGPAGDIYALGGILYALLTGHRPYERQAADARSLLAIKLEREPEPAGNLNPAIDRGLAAVCDRCLRMRPEARYPAALDLARDLRDFVNRSTGQS